MKEVYVAMGKLLKLHKMKVLLFRSRRDHSDENKLTD